MKLLQLVDELLVLPRLHGVQREDLPHLAVQCLLRHRLPAFYVRQVAVGPALLLEKPVHVGQVGPQVVHLFVELLGLRREAVCLVLSLLEPVQDLVTDCVLVVQVTHEERGQASWSALRLAHAWVGRRVVQGRFVLVGALDDEIEVHGAFQLARAVLVVLDLHRLDVLHRLPPVQEPLHVHHAVPHQGLFTAGLLPEVLQAVQLHGQHGLCQLGEICREEDGMVLGPEPRARGPDEGLHRLGDFDPLVLLPREGGQDGRLRLRVGGGPDPVEGLLRERPHEDVQYPPHPHEHGLVPLRLRSALLQALQASVQLDQAPFLHGHGHLCEPRDGVQPEALQGHGVVQVDRQEQSDLLLRAVHGQLQVVMHAREQPARRDGRLPHQLVRLAVH